MAPVQWRLFVGQRFALQGHVDPVDHLAAGLIAADGLLKHSADDRQVVR
jgi:hypothetical protein